MVSELYTHFDVLNRLTNSEASKSAPPHIRAASGTPSRILITVDAGSDRSQIETWLNELFGPRYDRARRLILLEQLVDGPERSLPVSVSELEDDASVVRVRLRPTLERQRAAIFNAQYERPNASDLNGCPTVMTFHSFKGGMGRTTLALALADGLVKRGRKVLFVDADFEAPGISTLLKYVMPSPRVSFADALALAHVSLDPEANDALNLVVERLSDQIVDGLTILPCTRDLGLPDAQPESLTHSSKRSAFFVGELLAEIGRRAGVDLVIVDLRAGLSEMVASLFLDPRLQHVLVTTLNGQAIDGTIMLLERMRDTATKWKEATGQNLSADLSVIINQVPVGVDAQVADALSILDEELKRFSDIVPDGGLTPESEGSSNPFFDRPISPILLPTMERIALLPRDLTSARKLISESDAQSVMLDAFLDLLPVEEPSESMVGVSRSERCQRLSAYAKAAIFAESAAQADIFPTQSLLKLAERHATAVPTVVVLGDKGAGKTYTYMSLAMSRTWDAFVRRLLPESNAPTDAYILPVTIPQDLGDKVSEDERAITENVSRLVSGSSGLNNQLIVDAIDKQKRAPHATGVSAWRNFWLDLIAWRCGHRPGEAGAFADLSGILQVKSIRVVAIFDGIETIFKQVRNNEIEQAAVEALLRAVPDWLAQLPGRQVGAIIFIREDVARLSLFQNFKQFEDRYGAYALKWNWAEALALAFWIAQKSGAITSDVTPTSLVDMNEEDRGRALEPLWGWKLGPNASKEARSQEWVMSSLSDFNRRIKARDLVRFLHEAARRSVPEHSYYGDERLLSPRGMRDAIDPCSISRVEETGEENQELKEIFEKVMNLSRPQQELPWRLEDAVQRIGPDSTRVLEEGGVLFRDGDEFYVPEVYRHGLRLYYSGGARRKVVTLMRRAPNLTR